MTNRRRDEAQRDRHSATFKEKCRTVHRPHNTVVVNHVIRKSEVSSMFCCLSINTGDLINDCILEVFSISVFIRSLV